MSMERNVAGVLSSQLRIAKTFALVIGAIRIYQGYRGSGWRALKLISAGAMVTWEGWSAANNIQDGA